MEAEARAFDTQGHVRCWWRKAAGVGRSAGGTRRRAGVRRLRDGVQPRRTLQPRAELRVRGVSASPRILALEPGAVGGFPEEPADPDAPPGGGERDGPRLAHALPRARGDLRAGGRRAPASCADAGGPTRRMSSSRRIRASWTPPRRTSPCAPTPRSSSGFPPSSPFPSRRSASPPSGERAVVWGAVAQARDPPVGGSACGRARRRVQRSRMTVRFGSKGLGRWQTQASGAVPPGPRQTPRILAPSGALARSSAVGVAR